MTGASEETLSMSPRYLAGWFTPRLQLLDSLSVFVMWGCIVAICSSNSSYGLNIEPA